MSEKKYIVDNEKLMSEWDWKRNKEKGLSPNDISSGSKKIVWWIGKCGHEWDAPVKDRVSGHGCPICAGKRVVIGVNDLQTLYPEIANEWHFQKNIDFTPNEVTPHSHKKVWWICKCGYEYYQSVDSRIRGRGCPKCGGKVVISGENDLKSLFPELADEWDIEKNSLLPNEVKPRSHKKVWWKCRICGNAWKATIDSRVAGNGCPKCANIFQSSFTEQTIFYYVKKYYEDAKNKYTEIFENQMEIDIFIPSLLLGIEYDGKHWHVGENSFNIEKRKYDICKSKGITLIRIKEEKPNVDEIYCDHLLIHNYSIDCILDELTHYLPLIRDVDVERDTILIKNEYVKTVRKRSLESVFPEIALEWNHTKNLGIKPNMVLPFSTDKYYWICPNGHEYKASVASRTSMNSKCPYCSNRKLLRGYNDFKTTNDIPRLFDEWNFEKNDDEGIYQHSIMSGSKKKVWWKCAQGHEWKTSPLERKRGRNCPYCTSRIVLEGFNDLQTINPKMAKEWHPIKNKDLKPNLVAFSSNKKVWWQCKQGHEWYTSPNSRRKGYGCSYCSGRKPIKGENDLATTHSELIKEWNYKKNSVSPTEISHGSERKVWWKCSKCGYEWQSMVKNRTRGSGCPECAKHKRIK